MPATDFARRPASGEYADYYDQYLNLATESDIVAAIENQIQEFRAVLDDQPEENVGVLHEPYTCLLYTSPSPRDATLSRMPSSA